MQIPIITNVSKYTAANLATVLFVTSSGTPHVVFENGVVLEITVAEAQAIVNWLEARKPSSGTLRKA